MLEAVRKNIASFWCCWVKDSSGDEYMAKEGGTDGNKGMLGKVLVGFI